MLGIMFTNDLVLLGLLQTTTANKKIDHASHTKIYHTSAKTIPAFSSAKITVAASIDDDLTILHRLRSRQRYRLVIYQSQTKSITILCGLFLTRCVALCNNKIHANNIRLLIP